MTETEKELVAAVESDIQKWEFEAEYFEQSVIEITDEAGKKTSGTEYARGLRQRIAEHRALVQNVKRTRPPKF
ncbi:MAG TPA: hypothetical protein VGT03_07935 [Candidatus Acidoferrales bacterium]|nr:hypothetical protein [Candidatus Acidoferrales bacterium]